MLERTCCLQIGSSIPSMCLLMGLLPMTATNPASGRVTMNESRPDVQASCEEQTILESKPENAVQDLR